MELKNDEEYVCRRCASTKCTFYDYNSKICIKYDLKK
jgi:hypothetical protein